VDLVVACVVAHTVIIGSGRKTINQRNDGSNRYKSTQRIRARLPPRLEALVDPSHCARNRDGRSVLSWVVPLIEIINRDCPTVTDSI
jgi:hypothetical protein